MAININSPLKINAMDNEGNYLPNSDLNWGPYSSKADAITAITNNYGEATVVPLGIKFGVKSAINGAESITEYQYKTGIFNATNCIEVGVGGGSSSGGSANNTGVIEVEEDGFYVVDSQNKIGLQYSDNGLDAASLSTHFINSLKDSIGNKSSQLKFTFIKKLFDNTDVSLPSIYFPCIINTSRIPNALGKYYIYYSLDHAGNNNSNSGIYMSYTDSLTGDWTLYGSVFKGWQVLNTGAAIETETPCVFWSHIRNKWVMTWHSMYNTYGYNQLTYISESDDGINWTYIKPLITENANHFTGDGHNGYFQCANIKGQFVGSHLFGGTDDSATSISMSADGVNWDVNPFISNEIYSNLKPSGTGTLKTNELSIMANGGNILPYNNHIYRIGSAGVESSGTAPSIRDIYIQEISDDYLTPLSSAVLLHSMDTALGESNNFKGISTFVDEDDTIYLVYGTLTGTVFSFFLAKLN